MRNKKIVIKPKVITSSRINWKKIAVLLGAILAVILIFKFNHIWRTRLFLNYFTMTQKIYIDPLFLKEKIDNKSKNYLLIDIRSEDEFQRGHIKTAVNIPAYQQVDSIEKTKIKASQIIGQYKKLSPGNKEIIIYSYLPNAQIIKDVVTIFMERGYMVKILAVGWQGWRAGFSLWNPAADIQGMDIGQYVEPPSYAPPMQTIGF